MFPIIASCQRLIGSRHLSGVKPFMRTDTDRERERKGIGRGLGRDYSTYYNVLGVHGARARYGPEFSIRAPSSDLLLARAAAADYSRCVLYFVPSWPHFGLYTIRHVMKDRPMRCYRQNYHRKQGKVHLPNSRLINRHDVVKFLFWTNIQSSQTCISGFALQKLFPVIRSHLRRLGLHLFLPFLIELSKF